MCRSASSPCHNQRRDLLRELHRGLRLPACDDRPTTDFPEPSPAREVSATPELTTPRHASLRAKNPGAHPTFCVRDLASPPQKSLPFCCRADSDDPTQTAASPLLSASRFPSQSSLRALRHSETKARTRLPAHFPDPSEKAASCPV